MQNIDARVRTLQAMPNALTKLISECSDNGFVSECPILKALDCEHGVQRGAPG